MKLLEVEKVSQSIYTETQNAFSGPRHFCNLLREKALNIFRPIHPVVNNYMSRIEQITPLVVIDHQRDGALESISSEYPKAVLQERLQFAVQAEIIRKEQVEGYIKWRTIKIASEKDTLAKSFLNQPVLKIEGVTENLFKGIPTNTGKRKSSLDPEVLAQRRAKRLICKAGKITEQVPGLSDEAWEALMSIKQNKDAIKGDNRDRRKYLRKIKALEKQQVYLERQDEIQQNLTELQNRLETLPDWVDPWMIKLSLEQIKGSLPAEIVKKSKSTKWNPRSLEKKMLLLVGALTWQTLAEVERLQTEMLPEVQPSRPLLECIKNNNFPVWKKVVLASAASLIMAITPGASVMPQEAAARTSTSVEESWYRADAEQQLVLVTQAQRQQEIVQKVEIADGENKTTEASSASNETISASPQPEPVIAPVSQPTQIAPVEDQGQVTADSGDNKTIETSSTGKPANETVSAPASPQPEPVIAPVDKPIQTVSVEATEQISRQLAEEKAAADKKAAEEEAAAAAKQEADRKAALEAAKQEADKKAQVDPPLASPAIPAKQPSGIEYPELLKVVDSSKGPMCEAYRPYIANRIPKRWVNALLRAFYRESGCQYWIVSKTDDWGWAQINGIWQSKVKGHDMSLLLRDPEETGRIVGLVFDAQGMGAWNVCKSVANCSPDD